MRLSMILKAALLAAVPLGTIASETQAATAYICKIDPRKGTWIARDIFIGHDQATKKIQVTDPIILRHNNNKPTRGGIGRENKNKITFAWNVSVSSSSGQNTVMASRADITKKNGNVYVSASPAGYNNRFTARGVCEIRTVKPKS